MTDDQKVLRQVRKIIRELRQEEQSIRGAASSRSTGTRGVYKAGYTAVGDIERAVTPKPRRAKKVRG